MTQTDLFRNREKKKIACFTDFGKSIRGFVGFVS